MAIIDRINRADNCGQIVKTGNHVYEINAFGEKLPVLTPAGQKRKAAKAKKFKEMLAKGLI